MNEKIHTAILECSNMLRTLLAQEPALRTMAVVEDATFDIAIDDIQRQADALGECLEKLRSDLMTRRFDRYQVEHWVTSMKHSMPRNEPLRLSQMLINPFEAINGFRDIWPDRQGAPEADALNWLDNPQDELKYLIWVNNSPVGITGAWPLEPDVMALAWSGLIPSAQGKGYWPKAFKLLVERIKLHRPETKSIVEPIPADRETELSGLFLKLGFVKTGRVLDHPELFLGVQWLEYRLELEI